MFLFSTLQLRIKRQTKYYVPRKMDFIWIIFLSSDFKHQMPKNNTKNLNIVAMSVLSWVGSEAGSNNGGLLLNIKVSASKRLTPVASKSLEQVEPSWRMAAKSSTPLLHLVITSSLVLLLLLLLAGDHHHCHHQPGQQHHWPHLRPRHPPSCRIRPCLHRGGGLGWISTGSNL